MDIDEKIQIASVLEELKVDIIEAGFPIASQGDFKAVQEISKNTKDKDPTKSITKDINDSVSDIKKDFDDLKDSIKRDLN